VTWRPAQTQPRGVLAALAIAGLAAYLGAADAARAAEIAPIDSPYCNIILQGDIAVGDLEKLKPAVESAAKMLQDRLHLLAAIEMYNFKTGLPAPPNSLEAEIKQKLNSPLTAPRTTYEQFQRGEFEASPLLGEMYIVHLCLSSGGGNFGEANKIIQYMTSGHGIATVIRAGDECFSACALVFMFGNIQTFGDNRFIDRRLDVRGKLGFHAPFVDAENVVTEEVARMAYQGGIEAVANLLEVDKKGFLSRPLVVDFLRKGPKEYLDLSTVEKAGEWAVELMGYKIPDDVSEEMLSQACANDIAWTARRRTSSSSGNLPSRYNLVRNWLWGKGPSEAYPTKLMLKLKMERTLYTRPTSTEENALTDSICCVVKVQRYQTPTPSLAVSIEQEKTFDEHSQCRKSPEPLNFNVPNKRTVVGAEGFSEITPAWFLYPPSTPLTAIAAH
jgi:hypothetical protein